MVVQPGPTLSSGTTQWFESVYFNDVTTGYIVGSGGTILKTVDGGTTWVRLSSGITDICIQLFLPMIIRVMLSEIMVKF